MTDDDEESLQAEIVVSACEAGHVHFQVVEIGSKAECHLHTMLSPEEASALARTLLKCALEAHVAIRNLPGIVGGDTGPCTMH